MLCLLCIESIRKLCNVGRKFTGRSNLAKSCRKVSMKLLSEKFEKNQSLSIRM